MPGGCIAQAAGGSGTIAAAVVAVIGRPWVYIDLFVKVLKSTEILIKCFNLTVCLQ